MSEGRSRPCPGGLDRIGEARLAEASVGHTASRPPDRLGRKYCSKGHVRHEQADRPAKKIERMNRALARDFGRGHPERDAIVRAEAVKAAPSLTPFGALLLQGNECMVQTMQKRDDKITPR